MVKMRIRELRWNAGLKQKELANRVGYTPALVNQWESGRCLPTTAALPALARELGCTIDELFEPESAGREVPPS